jgi:hypothetical protein
MQKTETVINGYQVTVSTIDNGATFCDVKCGRESANLEWIRDGGDGFSISPRTLYRIIDWAYAHGHR